MQAFYTQNNMVIQINQDNGNGSMSVTSVMFGDPNWDDAVALVEASDPIDDPVPTLTPPTAAEQLELDRDQMECSPFQGRVTLGPDEVARFQAILADDTNFTALGMTTLQIWILREAVKETIVWRRNSQAMATFAFLMGYDAAQMDVLFEAAMLVDV